MKKIAIVGSLRNDIFGIGYSYISYIVDRLEGEPIILAPTSSIREDIDLLILPGGADINPERYGAIPSFDTDAPDIIKDYFDLHHLPLYISKNIPIFGICRGIQTLNVHFGGTLTQSMYHETNEKNDPYKAVHTVISDNGKTKFEVNSRHHQAIDDLAKDLSPLLVHPKYRTIEAIRHDYLPILGVQWHPEDLYEIDASSWLINELKNIMEK